MTHSAEKENSQHLPVPALVLCGGRSRRMGQNKALLPFGNGNSPDRTGSTTQASSDSPTVLKRVHDTFRVLSNRLCLVIGFDAIAPPDYGFDFLVRDQQADLGPLEGLRAGFRQLVDVDSGANTTHVLVGTCDAPLVVPAVYQLMYQRSQESAADLVLPMIGDQHYPLTAVYRAEVLEEIESMVAARELRVKDLLNRLKVVEVSETELRQHDPNLDTVRNINTPNEYQAMLRDIRSPHPR